MAQILPHIRIAVGNIIGHCGAEIVENMLK